VDIGGVMKIILAVITVGILSISNSFAQCGGCPSGSKGDRDKKKEGSKETATLSISLE